MAAFAWQALDARGKLRQGVLEGESPRQLRQRLRADGDSGDVQGLHGGGEAGPLLADSTIGRDADIFEEDFSGG